LTTLAFEQLIFSLGFVNAERIEKGTDRPSMAETKGFFVNLQVPQLALKQIVLAMYSKDSNKKSNMLTVGVYTFLYLVWIALFVAVVRSTALRLFGWTCFFANGFILMSIKSTFSASVTTSAEIPLVLSFRECPSIHVSCGSLMKGASSLECLIKGKTKIAAAVIPKSSFRASWE
jgi:hypothetical protein